jgi:hypothetical protein
MVLGSVSMRRAVVGILVTAIGCTADLQRVHTPDLLKVDPKTAHRYRGLDPQTVPAGAAVPLPVSRLYTSLSDRDLMRDGDPVTAAVAPDAAAKDQFILVDLGTVQRVQCVRQDHAPADGYARRYRIDAAGDHNFPYTLEYVGAGDSGASIAVFRKPIRCRFLRITLLEPAETAWNVAELTVE